MTDDSGSSLDPAVFLVTGDRAFFRQWGNGPKQQLWVLEDGAAPRFVRDLAGINSTVTFRAAIERDAIFQLIVAYPQRTWWRSDGTDTGTCALTSPSGTVTDSMPAVVAGNVVWLSSDAGAVSISYGPATCGLPPVLTKTIEGQRAVPLGTIGKLVFMVLGPTKNTLWATDGTAAGTVPLGDVGPGLLFPTAQRAGDVLFFSVGGSNADTMTIWRTDGTPSGTFAFQTFDLPFPEPFATAGRALYFARPEPGGYQVVVTDGTSPGTSPLGHFADIHTGFADFGFQSDLAAALGDALIFSADADGTHGLEPYRLDAATTSLLRDIRPGTDGLGQSFSADLIATADRLFVVDDERLFVSDGTPQGTREVAAIPTPARFQQDTLGDALIFTHFEDGPINESVWLTDGTDLGTRAITPPLGDIATVVRARGKILFSSIDHFSGQTTLWETDGTPNGQTLVASGFWRVSTVLGVGNTVFFTSNYGPGAAGPALWRLDGDHDVTKVIDLDSYGGLASVGSTLFVATGALWVSNGTTAGTHALTPSDIYPDWLTPFEGKLFFLVKDALWKSDGTPAGTHAVPGVSAYRITAAAGKLFIQREGDDGAEPWVSDGTAAGTSQLGDIFPGPDSSYPFAFTQLGDQVFFLASDLLHGTELWALPVGSPPTSSTSTTSSSTTTSTTAPTTTVPPTVTTTSTMTTSTLPLTTVTTTSTTSTSTTISTGGDPCADLDGPCESLGFGPYVAFSVPDGSAVRTIANHQNGDQYIFEWTPNEQLVDLVVTFPTMPALLTQSIEGELPTLGKANELAAVILGLDVPAAATESDASRLGPRQTNDPRPGNHAGCDVIDDWLPQIGSCTDKGGCCDVHDFCIQEHCRINPDDSGNLLVCLGRQLAYLLCVQQTHIPALCGIFPRCSTGCQECHDRAIKCFNSIIEPGPSVCCSHQCPPGRESFCRSNEGDCGLLQQCLNGPYVETDPCICKAAEQQAIDKCVDGRPRWPGDGWGDTHIVTFDRLAYDFQAVGEFVLARTSDGKLEVQTRMAPWHESRVVSVITAVAMNVAGDRVGIYLEPTPSVFVNGSAVNVDETGVVLVHGGELVRDGAAYFVTWPDGSHARVEPGNAHLNVRVLLLDTMREEVEGLLGDFDGDHGNDLVVRGDTVPLGDNLSYADLYTRYGESWRVAQNHTLFDYAGAATTETYTDRSFPDALVTVYSLPSNDRQIAEQACTDAGVADPIVFAACVLDVALTGDQTFAAAAGNIEPAVGTVQVVGSPPTTAIAATTTTTSFSTTTTTIPCATARCALEAPAQSASCNDETVPVNITNKLDRASRLIEQAADSPRGRAKTLYRRAKILLSLASKAAGRAARGRNPKLSDDCASTIREAADGVRRGLRK